MRMGLRAAFTVSQAPQFHRKRPIHEFNLFILSGLESGPTASPALNCPRDHYTDKLFIFSNIADDCLEKVADFGVFWPFFGLGSLRAGLMGRSTKSA